MKISYLDCLKEQGHELFLSDRNVFRKFFTLLEPALTVYGVGAGLAERSFLKTASLTAEAAGISLFARSKMFGEVSQYLNWLTHDEEILELKNNLETMVLEQLPQKPLPVADGAENLPSLPKTPEAILKKIGEAADKMAPHDNPDFHRPQAVWLHQDVDGALDRLHDLFAGSASLAPLFASLKELADEMPFEEPRFMELNKEEQELLARDLYKSWLNRSAGSGGDNVTGYFASNVAAQIIFEHVGQIQEPENPTTYMVDPNRLRNSMGQKVIFLTKGLIQREDVPEKTKEEWMRDIFGATRSILSDYCPVVLGGNVSTDYVGYESAVSEKASLSPVDLVRLEEVATEYRQMARQEFLKAMGSIRKPLFFQPPPEIERVRPEMEMRWPWVVYEFLDRAGFETNSAVLFQKSGEAYYQKARGMAGLRLRTGFDSSLSQAGEAYRQAEVLYKRSRQGPTLSLKIEMSRLKYLEAFVVRDDATRHTNARIKGTELLTEALVGMENRHETDREYFDQEKLRWVSLLASIEALCVSDPDLRPEFDSTIRTVRRVRGWLGTGNRKGGAS